MYEDGHPYKTGNKYQVWWRDEEGKQHNTTFPKWYWETHVGPIPDGMCASYKDGNQLNIDPSNLALFSMSERKAMGGHKSKGKVVSEESRKKMSESAKTREISDEFRESKRQEMLMRWERGDFDTPEMRKVYSSNGKASKGRKWTDEQRQALKELHENKEISPETREKIVEALKRRWGNPEYKQKYIKEMIVRYSEHPEIKQRISDSMKGKEFTEEHMEHLHESARRGEDSNFWRGANNTPYGNDFTPRLKRLIRKRDNQQCQSCGKNVYRDRSGHVHHIDGNKANSVPENLILLCNRCHNAVHLNGNITSPKIEELRKLLTNLQCDV